MASRFLLALAGLGGLFTTPEASIGTGEKGYALLDVDDTVIEVHGYAKQGAGFGYSRVRGLNALLATSSAPSRAPVIVAQRLRRGACNSAPGAKRLVGDAVKTAHRLLGRSGRLLVQLDRPTTVAGRRTPLCAVAPPCR